MPNIGEKLRKVGKSGEKWEKVGKWLKVMKSDEKLEKWGKWEKWEKVVKSGEKWPTFHHCSPLLGVFHHFSLLYPTFQTCHHF